MDFFTVGTKLLNQSTPISDYVEDMAEQELSRIEEAEEILESQLTGSMEDHTQYIPCGYYEGDEKLESYFRAMSGMEGCILSRRTKTWTGVHC